MLHNGKEAFLLDGNTSLSFGGVDINLFGADFCMMLPSDEKLYLRPEYMLEEENRLVFSLQPAKDTDNPEANQEQTLLSFAVAEYQTGPELRISCTSSKVFSRMEIPIKLQQSSHVEQSGNYFSIVTPDKLSYRIEQHFIDNEKMALILDSDETRIVFGVEKETTESGFAKYDASAVWTLNRYQHAIGDWEASAYQNWNLAVPTSLDEKLIAGYLAESVSKIGLSKAIENISPDFILNRRDRTYLSTVYLGALPAGRDSLVAEETAREARLNFLVQQGSTDIFLERNILQYFSIRGSYDEINLIAAIAENLDADSVPLSLVPGILECMLDWPNFAHPEVGKYENPFSNLYTGCLDTITQFSYLNEDTDLLLIMTDDRANTEFNIRLGLVLQNIADQMGDAEWSAIGRAFVVCALEMANTDASLPAEIDLLADGERIEANESAGSLPSSLVAEYFHDKYYPRFYGMPGPAAGMYLWSGAELVKADYNEDTLTVSMEFPVGDTHYMIFVNVPPFQTIRIYNMNYRSDPQFERYDTSGWVYTPQSRTLLVKMKQRSDIESISLIF